MNRRENMLAIMNCKPHAHVGDYMTDVFTTGGNKEFFDSGPLGGGLDGFGCKWESSASALGQGSPAAGHVVLKDICDWKSVVQFPNIDEYDWKGQAEAQLERFDPENQVLEYTMWNGPFLRLTHLMGFEDGLCAMYEEPEACFELLDAITDYKIKVAERAVEYFKPDCICTFDDVATERSTFMSPEKYRELIKPMHKKFNDAVRAMGIIPNTHICGKCEAIVPDLVDQGTATWEICQPENDIVGLQKALNGRLAFMGGFDMKGPMSYTDTSEEQLRAAVRETIDKYAPGGNYAMLGIILYSDPAKFMSTISIVSDETLKYGTNYYK